MQWKDLAPILAKIGLPILGTAIAGPAGAAVGQMLGNAIGMNAEAAATPANVIAILTQSTEAAQKAKEFEATNANVIMKMHLDALSQSDQQQTELNKLDAASTSFFKSGWRPATGWACVSGLFYQIIVRPFLEWLGTNLWHWVPPPSLDMQTLMTLLFGLLGLGAYRTVERIRGKA